MKNKFNIKFVIYLILDSNYISIPNIQDYISKDVSLYYIYEF